MPEVCVEGIVLVQGILEIEAKGLRPLGEVMAVDTYWRGSCSIMRAVCELEVTMVLDRE